jgi:phosphate-selective porin OprO and OprP
MAVGRALAVGTLLLAITSPGWSQAGPGAQSATAQDPPFTMRIGARLQLQMTYTDPPGDERATNAFQVRRARLSVLGSAYEHFDYVVQLEMAGSNVRLLDANVQARFAPLATIWAGQGKAFFGRQQLTSSGHLQFVDRTLVDGRFSAGRQQGLAVIGRAGTLLEYNAGVYNGEGINQSTNPDDRFMTVGRLVVTPFGVYGPIESAHDYPSSPRLAFGVAGMHNTVGEDVERVGITRVNTEGAFKVHGLNVTAEFYREWAEPRAGGTETTDGWYLQAGYLLPRRRHELSARWAVIDPRAVDAGDLVETGLAYSYYVSGHRAKLQADVRNIRDRAAGTDQREVRAQIQLAM